MIKFCPFMTYREKGRRVYCFEEECGLYNESKKQCCIKTMTNLISQDNPDESEKNEIYIRFDEPYGHFEKRRE